MLETAGPVVNWLVVATLSGSCQNINNLAPLIFRVEVLAAKKLNFQPWSWQLWNWFNAGEIFPALEQIGSVSVCCVSTRSCGLNLSQSQEAISVYHQLTLVIGLASSLASPLTCCPRGVLLRKVSCTENCARAFFLSSDLCSVPGCAAGVRTGWVLSACWSAVRRRLSYKDRGLPAVLFSPMLL